MTARIGILETWTEPPEVAAIFGNPGQSVRRYLAQEEGMSFEVYAISKGQPLPALKECDAFIITGSEHSVYEPLSWIAPLTAFAADAIKQNIRIAGICFGHQIMAQACGGIVQKSGKGRGIGIHKHDLTPYGKRIVSGLDALRFMAAHQDQVVSVPYNSKLVATSPFCEYAAYTYGRSGFSVQGHPEILPAFERQIIQSWQQKDPVDPQIVDDALKSLERDECNTELFRPFLTQFLTGKMALE